MERATSPDLPYALPNIEEQPEDTPRSVDRKYRTRSLNTLTMALAPVMITQIMNFSDPLALSYDMTAFVDENGMKEALTAPAPPNIPQESAADAANRIRLELLAREYVAGILSDEEGARLAIVSERVRRLIPRVTVEDFEALEHILDDVQQIELSDITRRRRLGIE